MNKLSISTFIFLGFCLNICLLIFLPDGSNTVNLIIRLTGVIGVSWLIYFYFQFLGLESSQNHKKNDAAYKLIDIDNSAKDQFSDLIDLTFTTIKDINIDFEPAIYFIEPDSKGYILKDSTSKQFVSQLSIENSIVTKILSSNDINILYQKDNPEEWNNLFDNGSWRGSECVIIQPLLFNENTAGFIIVQSKHFSDIRALSLIHI